MPLQHSSKQDRKLAQLCAQVQEVLSLAFGEATDQRLEALTIDEVRPAPDASRLLVRCIAPPGSSLLDVDGMLEALQGARAWLRAQVAAEIRRKRTPDLTFVVLPPFDQQQA